MREADVSRRSALAIGASAAVIAGTKPAIAATTLTAGEVIERMKLQIGGPWREGGVDGFKAGGPDTVITGIATTMMATLDAMKARHARA